jgi:CHAD domain-containing protein
MDTPVSRVAYLADERIREWARALVRADVRVFAHARRRFLEKPNAERLHLLRTSARRLRSLYEDVRGVVEVSKRGSLGRLIALTGEARDASVLREALESAIDVRERAIGRSYLSALRKRERRGLKRVYRALLALHIEAPE